jgi:hypothetical protein
MIAQMFAAARLARILKLLDEERRILLSGPLSELSVLVARRETAISQLMARQKPLPEAFVRELGARAERNRRLIEASLEGVRAAASRLGPETAAHRTYTARGGQVDTLPRPGRQDKRA